MDTVRDRFVEVYERHYGDVHRYMARRLAGADVGDAVAEVFVVAWRRIAEVPSDAALPWLYGVARWVLANEVRGRRRWRGLTLRIAAESEGSVVADHADQVTSRLDIAMAFDLLPGPDREVLRMVAWERLEAGDAATALGCSRATFAMRLLRARRRLRSLLMAAGKPTGSVEMTGSSGIKRGE